MQAGTDSPSARKALETLCRNYWYPLYASVPRQAHGPHDAQDLTQAFFARLLGKNYLADVQREKGRFRSFLLASLNIFDERVGPRTGSQVRRRQALDRAGREGAVKVAVHVCANVTANCCARR